MLLEERSNYRSNSSTLEQNFTLYSFARSTEYWLSNLHTIYNMTGRFPLACIILTYQCTYAYIDSLIEYFGVDSLSINLLGSLAGHDSSSSDTTSRAKARPKTTKKLSSCILRSRTQSSFMEKRYSQEHWHWCNIFPASFKRFQTPKTSNVD